MKLYYFKDPQGNFGDDLNPWLWQQLFGNIFDHNTEDLFIGVGTLLNHRIPKANTFTVFGSGHGYGEKPAVTPNWKFYCVRGPLTAKTLGLDTSLGITDPASLSAQLYTPFSQKQFKVSFMPHCESARLGDWAQVCQQAGIHFIDPRKPFFQVFDGIRQSELLLTEAMHGAILADSFRVPWIPIKAYPHISEYKWQDWLQSVEVKADFTHISPIWRGDAHLNITSRLKNKLKLSLLDSPLWSTKWDMPLPKKSSEQLIENVAAMLTRVAAEAIPKLSKQNVLNSNSERLLEKVRQFKQDFGI